MGMGDPGAVHAARRKHLRGHEAGRIMSLNLRPRAVNSESGRGASGSHTQIQMRSDVPDMTCQHRLLAGSPSYANPNLCQGFGPARFDPSSQLG